MFLSLVRLLKQRVHQLRHIGSTAAVTYTGMALSLASAPLLAHTLGADGRGVLAGSFVAVQLLSWVTPLGLNQGIPLQIAKRQEISVAGIVVLSVLGIGTAVATLLAAPLLANGDERITLGIRIAATTLVFSGLGSVGGQLAIMRGQVWTFNSLRASSLVLPSLAQIALFAAGSLTVVSAYVTVISGQILGITIGFVVLIRSLRQDGRAPIPWAFSLRLWGGSFSDSMASRIDQMLLTALTPPAVVGVYAIAVTCANAAGGLTGALNQTAFGIFMQRAIDGRSSDDSLKRVARAGLIVSTLIGAAILTLVALLWSVLFGPGFESLPWIAAVLVAARMIQDQWSLRVSHQVANEDPRGLAFASFGGLAVMVLIIAGVASSGALTGVTMAFAYLAMCVVRLALRPLVLTLGARRARGDQPARQ